jgi:hypothetical protein
MCVYLIKYEHLYLLSLIYTADSVYMDSLALSAQETYIEPIFFRFIRGRRGHGHMVVGFTITYAMSAYHQ